VHLEVVDWLIIAGYLALSVSVGAYFSRKGSRSLDDFFVAGRSLPWWLAGMTMVASGFAIDTPLGITGLVAGNGIQGVWFAWAFILSAVGTMGAFVLAPLVRRSEVITIAELVELRYAGKQAAGLRLFKGIYFGLIVNAITLGSIVKAVWTVTDVVLGWNPHLTLGVVLLFTVSYSTMSGMWGIAATDVLQADLKGWIRREIGVHAAPEVVQFARALPRTREGDLVRPILERIAASGGEVGDISGLADPSVVDELVRTRADAVA